MWNIHASLHPQPRVTLVKYGRMICIGLLHLVKLTGNYICRTEGEIYFPCACLSYLLQWKCVVLSDLTLRKRLCLSSFYTQYPQECMQNSNSASFPEFQMTSFEKFAERSQILDKISRYHNIHIGWNCCNPAIVSSWRDWCNIYAAYDVSNFDK